METEIRNRHNGAWVVFFPSAGVGLLTLSGLQKWGVPGITVLSKGTYSL